MQKGAMIMSVSVMPSSAAISGSVRVAAMDRRLTTMESTEAPASALRLISITAPPRARDATSNIIVNSCIDT